MQNLAKELIRRQESLAAERAPLELHWQEIAELAKPLRADFTARQALGEKRQQKIYDATAGLAADSLAAGLWGMITNAANDWFALRSSLEESEESTETKEWLDEVSRRMRNAFAANGQKFYSRVMELYADLVTFGTAVFYTEEDRDTGHVYYACRHLAECFVAENDRDEIDTIFRRFTFSARQAYQRWGDQCGDKILKIVDREPERKFDFLHVVMPREDPQWRRLDGPGLQFASYYIDVEGGKLLSEGGYHEFPYQVPRWSTASRHAYGDSPAMLALPDIKMLNAMSKTTIIAAQKAVDPPLLAVDEAAVRGLRTHPGGIIYGGLDENGRKRYEPLMTGANIELGVELEEKRREAVREAFYFSLMLMVQQPNQTATEVLARQEEKLRLMGPHLGRIQSEFLDPLIKRQYAIMQRAGLLPKPPQQMAHSGLRIEYVSPLARAQRASEGAAIVRALEALSPLASMKPEIMDNIDPDATARAIAQAFGVPSRLLVDPRVVAERRAQSPKIADSAGGTGLDLKAAGAMDKMLSGMLGASAGAAQATAAPDTQPQQEEAA